MSDYSGLGCMFEILVIAAVVELGWLMIPLSSPLETCYKDEQLKGGQIKLHQQTFASKYSIVLSRVVNFSLSSAKRPRQDRSKGEEIVKLMINKTGISGSYQMNLRNRQSSWCCQ